MSNWKNPAPDASPVRAPTDSITTQVSPAGDAVDARLAALQQRVDELEKHNFSAREEFLSGQWALDRNQVLVLEKRLAALQQENGAKETQLADLVLQQFHKARDARNALEASEALAASLQRRVDELELLNASKMVSYRDEATAALQRRVETLTGALTTVHDWLANSAFDEAELPEALSIDDLVQIALAALTPEQGGSDDSRRSS